MPSRAARLIVVTLVFAAAATPRGLDAQTRVTLLTEHGDIVVELNEEAAPVTSRNFLRYVDAGLYGGGTIYRTVHQDNQPRDSIKIAVIQGGIDPTRRAEVFEPIRMESTDETGLKHLDGVISMARAGPNSAQGEFFICVGDQPELDRGGRRHPDGWGFAAFGRVVSGMGLVRRIHRMASDSQMLSPPVRILEVRRGLP